MGLISAALNAIGGNLEDQWIDFFTCDSMTSDILMKRGRIHQNSRSTNKGGVDVISNGSKINVADGQCLIIVENGNVVEYCAEPGQFIYNNKIAPSLMSGGLKDIKSTFMDIWGRFKAGGSVTNQQIVYYINIKEIMDNKIGWGSVPFRDSEFNFTVKVNGFGVYSFKITNPLLFYKNIAGNVTEEYLRSAIEPMLKNEVTGSIQAAFGRIATQKIAYDQLSLYPKEIGKLINDELSAEWRDKRGVEIATLAVAHIDVDDESRQKIEKFQESRIYTDVNMAAGMLASSQGDAMKAAAGNSGGAMQGFLGLNMANQTGGMNSASLFEMGKKQKEEQEAKDKQQADNSKDGGWTCKCGAAGNKGKFCAECGEPKPADDSWTCKCGATGNKGKFCAECGAAKPVGDEWTCECGATGNKGKFCAECGAAKK